MAGLIPPRNLEQKFEEDFSQHLQKTNRKQRAVVGAVGAGVGAVIGAAASPLLLPGLAAAAVLGATGGYQWAKRWGRQELQRHARASEASDFAGDAAQQAPTLRRLKYLVKWGHLELLQYEEAPVEWRCTVLDEVIRAFSPWVQKMYLLRARGVAGESDAEAREVFQHLAPLFYLLQRKITVEGLTRSAEATGAAFDNGTPDTVCAERCQVIFPTVQETISMLDRLSTATHVQLLKETQPSRVIGKDDFTAQRTHRRHRLQRIVDAIRRVLERADVKEALSSRRVFEHRTNRPNIRPEPDRGEGAASSRDENSPASASSNSDDHVPLVLPPEGVENEPGGACDDDHEQEYYSVSGESDEEAAGRQKSTGSRSPQAPRPAPDSGRVAGFRSRLEAFPNGDVEHSWREFDASTFDLRSATYLSDRRKTPSDTPMLELVNVDFQLVGPSGPVWRVSEHPDFFPAQARKAKDNRFFLVQNWVFPPYQCVMTGALNPGAAWCKDASSPESRVWRKFLEADEDGRRDVFKVIISVERGPWLVKRAVPKKPVLIGKRMKMSTQHVPGSHLEIVIDVASGRAEQVGTGIACGALRRLQMVHATVIEARTEEELPETLLMCASMLNLDPGQLFSPQV